MPKPWSTWVVIAIAGINGCGFFWKVLLNLLELKNHNLSYFLRRLILLKSVIQSDDPIVQHDHEVLIRFIEELRFLRRRRASKINIVEPSPWDNSLLVGNSIFAKFYYLISIVLISVVSVRHDFQFAVQFFCFLSTMGLRSHFMRTNFLLRRKHLITQQHKRNTKHRAKLYISA